MSRSFKVRHEWLRNALVDKGKTQRDLAKAWGINEAQASRYINHGEPELTLERAQTLKMMLGMSLDEIFMRDAERPMPQVHEEVAETATPSAQALDQSANPAIDELKRAVEKVRAALGPGYTVEITIKAGGY